MLARFTLLLLCLNVCFGYAGTLPPSASITISSTASVCQNSAGPTITFTGSGGTAPYTFTYTINGGTPQTIVSSGTGNSATLPGNTSVAGTRNYTLVSVEDDTETLVNIGNNVSFTVLPQPDAAMGGTGGGSVFDGLPVFRICGNTTSTFNFTNTSNTLSSNQSYTINWGDGTPNFSGTTWTTLSHSYNVGIYTLTYTIVGTNGCSVTKLFTVFVGLNPAVALGNPGNTDICSNQTLTFPITGTANNPIGTIYTVTFNDGSAPQVFNHPPPAGVTHTFNVSSCGTTSSDGSNSYPNSFSANIVASNPCSTSSVGVVPIYVSKNPEASFDSPPTACVATQVCFQSTSSGNAVLNGTCEDPKLIWSISPVTGFTLAGGSILGNDFGFTDTGLWQSGSQNLCLSFTSPGTYTITLKIGNKCGVDTQVKTICVAAPLNPQFTLNNTSGCAPMSVTATNTTNMSALCGTASQTWSVTHTPGFCGTTPVTIPNQTGQNASFNFTQPGTYTITLTTTNSCGTTQTSQTVTVKKAPTASINPIGNLCGPGSITPQATVNSCAPASSTLTYAWSFPGGTPATSTAANPGPVSYSTAGNHTITVVVTNECGSSTTATQTFTLNPQPVVGAVSNQTICSGTSTTAVTLTSTPPNATFTWTATASAGVSGFQASGTGNIPSTVLTYTGSGTGTVTYTITPTLNGCQGPNLTYQIQVAPAPVITAQPQSQTLCQNATPSALTMAVTGSGTPTFQWYVNTTASTTGGTLIPGATSSNYSPPTTNIGTLYYYAVASLPTGGCASLTSQIATITVVAPPSITTQPTLNNTVCVGATVEPLSVIVSGGTGTVSYQWYSNTTATTTGGTAISGATSATYTPPTFTVAGTYYYYVVASASGNGCGQTASQPVTVTVIPDPVITTQPAATQTLCQGATPEILTVTASGGSGSFSYQWYSNSSNSTTGGSPLSGATSSSFTPPTSSQGTTYYYVVVSQPTSGCSVTSAPAQIIVNPSPSVSNQPQPATVCLGGSVPALTFAVANGAGSATYQWYSNTSNNTATGQPISGATSNSFTPPTALAGQIWYYATATFSGISGSCATVVTQTALIEVVTGPEIQTQPVAEQTVCVGGTVPGALSVAYTGGTGTPAYQWYSNTTNSTTGGTPVGTNSSSFTPPVFTTPGEYFYYVTITLAGSGCGTTTSAVSKVIVLPDPELETQPIASQTLCQGSTPQALSVSATGGEGTFSYQWYSNTSTSTTGGTIIPGANQASYTPTVAAVGNYYYYCVVSQPTSGCEVTSQIAQITVNTSPSVTVQPVPSQICQGGTAQQLSFATQNGAGTATYQWYSNTVESNTGGIAIAGATTMTYDPPTGVVGALWYYATVTFSGITGDCATIATQPTLVEVSPNAEITVQPEPKQSVCVGHTLTNPLSITYSQGTGAPTYQWYSNSTNSTTGGTPVGTNQSTYTPPAFTSPGTYYYYVTVQLSGNGCNPVTSQPAQVVVVADPEIAVQPINAQTLCPTETPQTLSVTATGGIGGDYNYQWYVSTTPGNTGGVAIGGATGPDFVPPTDQTGTFYYYCEVTQPNGLGCNVTSQSASITVSPAPAINTQPVGQTLCGGQSASPLSINVVNGVGTPVYQWYSNTIASNADGTAISGANQATYTPQNTTVGTLHYYVTVSYPDLTGNCSSVTSDVTTVTIEQNPEISDQSAVICSSTAFSVTPTTNGTDIVPASTTYSWGMPVITPPGSVTGASAESNPQTTISQTLINTTTQPATVIYTVTPVAGDCTGQPFTISVTVNPAIAPNVTVNDNLCFGTDNAGITTNVTGGIPFPGAEPYQFSWTGPDGFASTAPSIANLAPGNYTVTITDAGGCPFTETYTITEPPQLVFDSTVQQNITCHNAADGSITLSIAGGTPGYIYSWTKDTMPFSDQQNLTNLAPGLYVVSVTDTNNCTPITMEFNITQPDPLVAALISQTNVECYGESTGAILVSVTGGTPIELTPGNFGYTYSWTGPNGFTSNVQNPSNLFAGDYSLTLTDNNNCQFTLPVAITQSAEIIISYTTTEITCYGANDANMTVTLSGGVGPYTFTWSNFSTVLNQTNLSAGTYTIIVTDALGCQKTETIVIPEAPLFAIDPVVTQISCHGEQDGSIQLNFVGGIAPVTLVWSDGSTAGTTRNGLAAGTYTVTITDSKPCVITQTFIIVEPAPLVLSASLEHALACDLSNDGAIDLLVSGGTPPYAYSWSNGSNQEDLTLLTNGNYSVTVTDSRGCVIQGQYTILRPDPIAIQIVENVDFDCETRYVDITYEAQVSGGVPPFAISWSSGTVSGANNQFMNTSNEGLVTVTVTDSRGCDMTLTYNVDIPQLGTIGFEPVSAGSTYYGIFSIEDPITFESILTGDYQTLIWDFGDGTFSNEVNPVHTYVSPGAYVVTQTVTYPLGCQYTQTITLNVEEGYFLTIPTAFTPNDDSLNDTYRPVAKRLDSLTLEIYDSWGSMIYSEKGDVLTGWDGTIKGLGAENGNYYCTVTGKTFYGRTITERRTFVLIK